MQNLNLERNYYVALLFQERDDLHLTLTYYRKLSVRRLAHLIFSVDDWVQKEVSINKLKLTFDKVSYFGLSQKNRVLLCKRKRWPAWILNLTSKNWNPYNWKPHISCQDDNLTLTVSALAIMHKDTEIVRWQIS